ncbi:N-formylglutamate amidohydrolase [Mucilaginibacter lutimaris]|uniref:N-formylglutamate amidohydrolase n=1 Tax=Mucilaginibacter lutimaris TaxID=931629 RepID=A0ABW2ZI32_9SPHI
MVSNLILHIPHASDNIPDRAGYVVTDDRLKQEMSLLTDWYTEELFAFEGCIRCVADFNRVFCDVERFADDNRESMSTVGMGVAYTKCDDGSELRNVSPELKASILNDYYYPHHQKLSNAVAEQLERDGRALIIDCHSFANEPFNRDLDKKTPRPAICIGTDGFHTPEGLITFTYNYFKFAGYKVQINTPYSGSMVPLEYYQQDNRVHSMMIEVNRDVYMVPGTNTKGRNYVKIKRAINKYLYKVRELMYCDYPHLSNEASAIPLPPAREI